MAEWNNLINNINIEKPENILYSGLILVVAIIVNWSIKKIINNRVKNLSLKYKWRKITTYLVFSLALLLIGTIWFRFSNLATILGIFTAGLAIALRDLITSFIGWLYILWKRPFTTGDRIQIGDTAGDVIDISLLQFSLIEIGKWVAADQSTGRVVHLPNKIVFSNNIANYTAGFSYIWNEIPVLITFESDWERAKKLLLEFIKNFNKDRINGAREELGRAGNKYFIYYKNLTPIVYTSVKKSGVQLTIRYLCKPQHRRTTENIIWENIIAIFKQEEEFDFAYPTRRFYFENKNE